MVREPTAVRENCSSSSTRAEDGTMTPLLLYSARISVWCVCIFRPGTTIRLIWRVSMYLSSMWHQQKIKQNIREGGKGAGGVTGFLYQKPGPAAWGGLYALWGGILKWLQFLNWNSNTNINSVNGPALKATNFVSSPYSTTSYIYLCVVRESIHPLNSGVPGHFD